LHEIGIYYSGAESEYCLRGCDIFCFGFYFTVKSFQRRLLEGM
jgi:hypothetical protein